jgi:asparagine synthase (glutamine-hydrolysing)
MCGLVGFVGAVDDALLERMTRQLAHRGPDEEGTWIDNELGVHLGHRRLAIIDIDGGHQPMWNEDGTVGIIFNGQIYNHIELRRELLRLGHVFRSSHADTEVLVHGYEAWGHGLAERLNGMFAFAIVDRRARRLYLARDRFGEKPLYWSRIPGGIAFASELSTLALHPHVSKSVDQRALQKFFAHGFVPAPNAILQGVYKLSAGSWIAYDLTTQVITERRYWRFRVEPDESLGPDTEPRLVDELRARLHEAVSRRLMSDVPLGIFLSGGVDSSTVLAFARGVLPNSEIKTFTIGFTEPSYDETEYAARVAAHFDTLHLTETFDLDKARELAPQVLGRLDEPLADPSLIPTFLLSRFTRRHVTVALSGDGCDELFAGYDPFAALRLAQIYSRVVPRIMHGGMMRLADLIPRSTRNMSLDFKIRRALLGLSYDESLWNPVWLSPMSPDLIRQAFEEPLSKEDLYSEVLEAWQDSSHLSLTDRTLEFFTRFYLQDDILTKVDRAAMMNSLECRAVFLDNDLVDFARSLPSHFKYRSGKRKYLLKQALRGMVPDFVLDRSKKGFGIPLAEWLRDLEVPRHQNRSDGLSPAYVDRLIDAHGSRQADHRLAIWSLIAYRNSSHSGASSCRSRRGLVGIDGGVGSGIPPRIIRRSSPSSIR